MVYVLVFSIIFSNLVSASSIWSNDINDGIFYAELELNENLTKESFRENLNGYITKNQIDNLTVKINNNDLTAKISGDLSVILKGEVNEITENGFVGIFEGTINENTPVLSNLTYTEEEIFMTLTIGYLGTEEFETAFFGIDSNTINEIDNLNAQKFINQQKKIEENDNLNKTNIYDDINLQAIDASTRYQGGRTLNLGGLKAIELSIYHANELKNQNSMKISAKVNTQSTNIASYLKNNVYTTATAVVPQPDKFTISILGNNSTFDIIGNSCTPASGVNSFTMYIPYYTATTGFGTFGVPIKTSSTSITTSKEGGASYANKAQWELSKNLGGWPAANFNGDKGTKTGMAVTLDMHHSGTMTSSLKKPISCTTKVRFYVNASIGNQIRVYSYETPILIASSNVLVLP